jgi:hypothetical protein
MDTAPGVITHLAAFTGDGTVTFTWLDPADTDLDHIEIWFGTSPSATSGTVLPSAARGAMTAAWNGAVGEILYYHFIAVDKAGNRSAVVNYAVTLSSVLADVTNLVGMITGAQSVKLTWTDPVSSAFSYANIENTTDGGAVNVPKGTEQSAWNGLSSAAYTFTVKAFNGGSPSGVQVSMSLTQDATPPGVVTGLSAIDGGFGSVELNWTSPGDTDVQYVEITCDPLSGPAQTISVSAGAAGSYTWTGLAGGVEYTFTVKAVDHSGNKSDGRSVTGTPLDTTPAGPVTSLAGISGDGSVVLSWTDPGDADLEWVQIECNEIPGPAKSIYPGTGTYTWSGLTKGESYTFTVTTRDATGNLGAAVTVGPVPVILAGGGTISLVKVEGSSPLKWWEIHTFTTSGALSFPSGYTSVTADYLIVAGGGGAGGGSWWAGGGGGGAGGLLYKTGQTLALDAGSSAAVIVGAGGGGGAKNNTGANGEKSAVGSVEVPGGGAGGGTKDSNNASPGLAGGSGGGGGCGYYVSGAGGAGSAYGYAGGKSGNGTSNTNSYSGSGGGGGAGGAGSAGYSVNQTSIVGGGGAGGAAWNATSAGAAWIAAATGTNLFSAGGKGGNFGGGSTHTGGAAGPNYGDGGSGGTGQGAAAGGHRGVVVIRFQRN